MMKITKKLAGYFNWQSVYPFGLAVFVLWVFFYRLTESPPVWYDEGIYFQVADNFAKFFRWGLQTSPGEFASLAKITVGYPALLPVGIVFKIFGASLLAGRATMAFFAVGLSLAAYYLIKKQCGAKSALISLLLLATFPVFYGNAKNIIGEVPGLFYMALFLFFVSRLELADKKTVLNYAAAGLFGGLCVATKPLFIVLIPAFMAGAYFWRHKIRWPGKASVIFGVSFIVPVILWLGTQFNLADSAGSVMAHFYNPYAVQNLAPVMWQNFLRFFREPSAMYFFGLFFIWSVSVAARWRKKNAITLAEVTAFIFSLLITLAYLRTVGWYRYFFPANFWALIYLPFSITTLIPLLPRARGDILRYFNMAAVFFVVFLAAAQMYQLKYSSWVALHYGSRLSGQLTEYFGALPEQSSVYIYNVPAVLVFLKHSNYYQYISPVDSIQIGHDTLGLLKDGVPQFVVLADGAFKNSEDIFYLYKLKDAVAGRYIVLERY